jgi:hypothetical protein
MPQLGIQIREHKGTLQPFSSENNTLKGTFSRSVTFLIKEGFRVPIVSPLFTLIPNVLPVGPMNAVSTFEINIFGPASDSFSEKGPYFHVILSMMSSLRALMKQK